MKGSMVPGLLGSKFQAARRGMAERQVFTSGVNFIQSEKY